MQLRPHTQNYNHPFLAHTYFTPVVDAVRTAAAIVPVYPREAIAASASKPAMIGVTSGECTAYILYMYYGRHACLDVTTPTFQPAQRSDWSCRTWSGSFHVCCTRIVNKCARLSSIGT